MTLDKHFKLLPIKREKIAIKRQTRFANRKAHQNNMKKRKNIHLLLQFYPLSFDQHP